jgi:hypothetical protein
MRRLRVPLSYATDEVDLQGARERWFQNGRRAWAWAGESWRAARESRAGEQSGIASSSWSSANICAPRVSWLGGRRSWGFTFGTVLETRRGPPSTVVKERRSQHGVQPVAQHGKASCGDAGETFNSLKKAALAIPQYIKFSFDGHLRAPKSWGSSRCMYA